MDDYLLRLIFGTLSCLIGILSIYGAYKKWKFLIDPPESLAGFYSQAWIKKLYGRKFLLWETYIMGVIFIAMGVVLILKVV
jgi:hypothetical protein